MATPPADDATLPIETLGPYRLRERLGARGRFTAWRAEDAAGRPVGVQVLTAGPPQPSVDPATAERFADGAERLAELRHPNVLQVLAHGEAGGRLYLATEPTSLGTLGAALRERAPSVEQAIGVFQAILAGLTAAHQKGIVHGEIHPDTVLASPDLAQVKLTGFGLGRPEGAPALGATGTLSTGEVSLAYLAYLAPEQADGKPATARSDLYSAGVMFNQMLTGKAPSSRFTLPTQANSRLPPELDALVLKCLARNPAERYANVQHILGDLARVEELLRLRLMSELKGISRSVFGQGGQSGSGESAARETGEPAAKAKSPLLWVGIAVALVVVAVVVFLLIHR
jgi:eukaryotic-like serine/threonine-protein kinase